MSAAEPASISLIRMDADRNHGALDQVASARSANEFFVVPVHTLRIRPGMIIDQSFEYLFPFSG